MKMPYPSLAINRNCSIRFYKSLNSDIGDGYLRDKVGSMINSDNYDKDAALAVLCSQEHQTARSIVQLYHCGMGIPEICNELGVSPKRAFEVLL